MLLPRTPFHIQIKTLIYEGYTDEEIARVMESTLGTMAHLTAVEVASLRRGGLVPNHIEARQDAPSTWPKVLPMDARNFIDLPDSQLKPWQYAHRYALPQWASPQGKHLWARAARLWANGDVRRLLCALLLCRDIDDAKALSTLKLYYQHDTHRVNRGDIATFRSLYWDFAGWSISEIMSVLETDADFKGARLGLIRGKEAALFALGLVGLDIRHDQMFAEIRNQMFMKLHQYAVSDRFNPRDYKDVFAVFTAAVSYIDGNLPDDELPFDEFVANMQLQEQDDFASLDDIISGAGRSADLELVMLARTNGRIAESDATAYSIAIEKGTWPDSARQHLRGLLSLDIEAEEGAEDLDMAVPSKRKAKTRRRSAG